jgi:glycosyltransferase involved in cell wall biosynthesis
MKKHVLYIGPDYRNHRGGIGAVLAVYADYITPFKFISTYPHGSFLKKIFTYFKAIVLLFGKLIADRDIKIVHIHSASKGSFLRKSLMVMISKLFGKKVIFHVHGAKFHIFYENAGLMRGYIRFIIGLSDVIVCLSEQWKNYFESAFPGKQIAVINNVIDPPKSQIIPVNDSKVINFLFLGYIGERKGIYDLIEVLNSRQNNFVGRYRLTVGGNGEVEQLKQIISKGNNGDIHYAGWVKGEKKNELLSQCDVYVLPSYNEGLPISVLEAMSYGKPIISTTVGGIPEIVKPGFNGWLMQPGDRSALRDIILEAIDQKEKLVDYGKNSLLLAQDYMPGSVLNSLDVLYSKLIDADGKLDQRAA